MEIEEMLGALGLLGLAVVVAAVLLFVFRVRLSRFAAAIQFERARESFKLQREQLHQQFLQAAAASGLPRGLHWKSCDWEPVVEFALDRRSGHIVAFAGVTIYFEAVEGSEMEGLSAVSLPRNASALFSFYRGHWHTTGQAVFNKNPDEAADHFHNQYERLGPAL